MLPPEWFPTISTGPESGMLPSPRTSPRYQRLAASHISGSRSRMKSGSRSSRSARGIRRCTWRGHLAQRASAAATGAGLPLCALAHPAVAWPLLSAPAGQCRFCRRCRDLPRPAWGSRRLGAGGAVRPPAALGGAGQRDLARGRRSAAAARWSHRAAPPAGRGRMTAIVTCSASGSHLRTWRPNAGRDEAVVGSPDEQRRRRAARPAADRSRGGRRAPPDRCCAPRPGTPGGRRAEW